MRQTIASALLFTLLLAGPAATRDLPSQSTTADRRTGAVRISGRAVADDGGEFAALGASLFWAAWAYRNDRPRLDEHLKLLSEHGFDYIRALGVVGRQPYWAGREIDWRWADYDAVIAGLTDHAYDRYGLRIEWTIFADAEQVIPQPSDRAALIDRFLAMSRGREHKIMHFEVANESWQNGFGGADGVRQIRELTARLAAGTAIPVAVSDSEGHGCADHLTLYGGLDVEILTEHLARSFGPPHQRWNPAVQPWTIRDCKGLPPVISNNEPLGPKSSVESESDPLRLVASAVSSYMAGVGLYVFHTDAGVWGREPLSAMPGANATLDGFAAMKRYLPPDTATSRRHRRDSPEHPFKATGGVEVFASVKADRLFALVIGTEDGVTLEATRAMDVELLDVLTGRTLERHTLKPGAKIAVSGVRAAVLRGKLL